MLDRPIASPDYTFVFSGFFIYISFMERLFWCDVKYACYGIVSKNGVISEAAPIASWMIGKTLRFVMFWLKNKNAKVVEIK